MKKSLRFSISPFCLIFIGTICTATPAFADPVAPGLPQSEKLLTELLGLFVTATVLESALTIIFQWRLYREFFNSRAVKTLVMIAVSFAVVKGFSYDIFARIVGLAGGTGDSSLTSQGLSALVLAGGSAAIYQLLKNLGFRPPVDPPEERAKPPENQAWVSIKIIRREAIGPIRIHIDEVAQPSEDVLARSALAGTIGGRPFWERLRGVFFADSMRFPPYGGQSVKANTVYRIVATGQTTNDSNGDPRPPFEREIFNGRIAGRAIIDFTEKI